MNRSSILLLVATFALPMACKAVRTGDPEPAPSNDVLGKLEAVDKGGAKGPEIVSLPAPPLPPSMTEATKPAPVAAAPPPPPAPSALADESVARARTQVGADAARPRTSRARPAARSAGGQRSHIVARGETLQKISLKYYGTTRKWHDIYEANRGKIKKPDMITVGMVIVIP